MAGFAAPNVTPRSEWEQLNGRFPLANEALAPGTLKYSGPLAGIRAAALVRRSRPKMCIPRLEMDPAEAGLRTERRAELRNVRSLVQARSALGNDRVTGRTSRRPSESTIRPC